MNCRIISAFLSALRPSKMSVLFPICLVYLAGCSSQKTGNELPRLFITDKSGENAEGIEYKFDPNSKYVTYNQDLKKLCLDELIDKTHKDYAMLASNRALIYSAMGELEIARRYALDAQEVMFGFVEGEDKSAGRATIGSGKEKVFKGESYEMAMINAFIGITSLRLGDPETAAIGFRRALDADKYTAKEDSRDDFTLAYWGLGMAALDHPQVDIEDAKAMFRRCNYQKEAEVVRHENLVVFVFLGSAPWKELGGMYGDQCNIKKSEYDAVRAEVLVDNEPLGECFRLIDLYEQSQGVRNVEAIGQAGKAVGKFMLSVLANVVAGSNASNMVDQGYDITADWRTCYMLPNEILVVSAKVKPGLHTVHVKFYNEAKEELKRFEQIWHYVPTYRDKRQYIAVRSEFDRCNIQGPLAFTRVNKVKKVKQKESDPVIHVCFRASNIPDLKIGDTVQLCHFYRCTEMRSESRAHWHCPPMQYNGAGVPIGRPGDFLRTQDYDIGHIGEAKVLEVEEDYAVAVVGNLKTDYVPVVNDYVTKIQKNGLVWQ